jgi:hypothetical protein
MKGEGRMRGRRRMIGRTERKKRKREGRIRGRRRMIGRLSGRRGKEREE